MHAITEEVPEATSPEIVDVTLCVFHHWCEVEVLWVVREVLQIDGLLVVVVVAHRLLALEVRWLLAC